MWQKFWPDFYPRSPCGERPSSAIFSRTAKNFYPRSPCGERRLAAAAQGCGAGISIHALLAESDCTSTAQSAALPPISIHALLAESDERAAARKDWEKQFLSTLSLRRATIGAWLPWPAVTYFYPRSPCGERLGWVVRSCKGIMISIHALLAESDSRSQRSKSWQYYFYPRSPCGERLRWKLPCTPWHIFLSTLSLRRATGGYKALGFDTLISIHALLAESDFNGDHGHMSGDISIHALLAESDVPGYGAPFVCTHFYPRSPCGERQAEQTAREQADKFLSTLSLRRATVLASINKQSITASRFLSTLSLRRATAVMAAHISI